MSKTKEPVFQLVASFRKINKMTPGEVLKSLDRETKTVWDSE